MTFKSKIISVVVLIVLGLVGLYFYTHNGGTVAGVSAPVSPPSNVSNLIASENVGSPLFQFLGAQGAGGTAALPIASTTALSQSIVAATTTLCAFQNPFTATSSFAFALNITTGTSSASVLTISTSTTAYGTTSSATTFSIPASTQASVSYPGGLFANVGPLGYVVLGTAAGANGGSNNAYTYVGRCQGIFTSMF